MGRRNKVVKLTAKKVSYINRAKIKNDSNRNIARDMKISMSTVKRVWTHWLKYHEPLPIEKFGRKKKVIDEGSENLIIEVYKEQKLGARRLDKVIKFKHGKHIPHNTIHQVLLKKMGWLKRIKTRRNDEKPGFDMNESTA